jgi:hypothetical protein
VRIDGEKPLISLAAEMPIIMVRPGERKVSMIDLLNVTVEKPESVLKLELEA